MISPVSRYETFQNDTRGGVAMIFALSLTSLMMLIGCAVDYGRSIHARGKLAAAADIASLAAARDLRGGGKTDDEVRTIARTYFDQNMAGSGNYATLTAFDVAINGAKNAVTIGLKAEMPTSFMRVGGITKINLPLTSTAVYDTKDIEVGLQLDVTGSMCSPCTKISDLKVATKDLLEILLPDGGTPNKVRIGLAPFAAGVNAGSYARDVAGGTAPGNCVYERASASRAATDTSPSGMDRMLTKTDLPRAGDCPAGTSVVALTDNKTTLRTAVDRLTTGGSTAGHLGTAWAWYLVSPNWSSVWPTASRPASYGDKSTVKATVLMTDGEYNTVSGEMSGRNETESQNRAKALCENMRAQGIAIYTVGFKVGSNAGALDVLRSCAGTTGKFFTADNGEELRATFRTIAQHISRLRLSN